MKKKTFLVFQDWSTSGQWLYLYARSKEDIERRFPEFYLFDVPPKRFDALHAQIIEVDGRPGMLFVKVLRQGLIWRPLFRNVPGLRLFSIGFTKDPVANRSLHKA